MSNITFNRLDLLLREIDDPYVQENFRRLKQYLDENYQGGDTTINQDITVIDEESPWIRVSDIVNTSTTSVVDTLALSSFNKIEYIITYKDLVTGEGKGLNVTVINDNGTIKESVYAITGAPLDVDLDTDINGSNYELEITNNEPNNVEVILSRLILN